MSDSDLKIPRGNYSIFSNDHYIVAIGNGIFVYDKCGKLLWRRENLKYIYKIAFLSQDSIIADCGSLGLYIVFSLLDGTFLKQFKIPKCSYTGNNFAISHDSRYVYDLYFCTSQRIDCYALKLDLYQNTLECCPLDVGLQATCDIICDESDTLCILQSQYEMIGKKEVSIFGIRYEFFDALCGKGSAYFWRDKWFFELPRDVKVFVDNVNQILTNDCCIYNASNRTIFKLLENETLPSTENISIIKCKYDKNKQYLQLICRNCDIIIDITRKKIIARYITEAEGCLVGDEFWLCSTKGIIRKPFPLIEGDSAQGQGDGSIV